MSWRFFGTPLNNYPLAGAMACVAEYNAGPSDNDHSGLIDPLNNLSKVNFHSSLDYLRQAYIVKSSDPLRAAVSIPAVAYNALYEGPVILFAHGLGYRPLVSGTITVNGYTQPLAGSTMPIPGGNPDNMGWRWLDLSADQTYVYMWVRSFLAPAMTVHWTVRVLDERFQVRSDSDDLIRLDPTSVNILSMAKIDDAHRFLRQAPVGDPGEFRVMGVPTLKITKPTSTMRQINFSDGATHTARFEIGVLGHQAVTPQLTASGVNCVTGGGVCARGAGFHWDQTTGPILAAATNDVIWTVKQPSMVSLGHVFTTLTLSQHNPTDYLDTGLHVIDHDLGPVPPGTTRVEGWGQMGTAGGFLPPSVPFPLSGGFINMITGGVNGSQFQVLALQMLSPLISGGRIYMREEWWNYTTSGGYLGGNDVQIDMRFITFVGGNG